MAGDGRSVISMVVPALRRSLASLGSLGLLVLLATFARADQWQDGTGYPSASGWQAGYPSSSYGAPSPSYGPPTYNTGSTGCATGFNDILPDIGVKNNILATGASAAIAAILAKLPALIIIKLLIFKLIVVPILFVVVAIPVLAPLLMMILPMMMNMMNMMGMGGMGMTTPASATTQKPASRSGKDLSVEEGSKVTEIDEVVRSLLGSHRCLERVACTLGAKDRESSYRKPITWLLKQLQAMVPADLRDQVKLYRQAYMSGAAQGCDAEVYQCQTPQLLVQQDDRTYRLL